MPTWLILVAIAVLLLDIPRLCIWFILMKAYIFRPDPEYTCTPSYLNERRDTANAQVVSLMSRVERVPKEIAFFGDSCATGSGASTLETTMGGLASDMYQCIVHVVTKPFAGIQAVPDLLRKHRKSKYTAIIISAGGNDALIFRYLSLKKIEQSLRDTIRIAREITDNLIILGNFDALGNVYPVWWLRIIFGFRGESIRKIYERVCDSEHVVLEDVSNILTDKQNRARDGVHPNDRAYAAMIDRIRDRLQQHLT